MSEMDGYPWVRRGIYVSKQRRLSREPERSHAHLRNEDGDVPIRLLLLPPTSGEVPMSQPKAYEGRSGDSPPAAPLLLRRIRSRPSVTRHRRPA